MRTFLRRVAPNQVIFDENIGRWRASSGIFRDPDLSCDDEVIQAENGLTWMDSLKNHQAYSLVRFPEAVALQEGQKIEADPLPNNIAHTLVKGKKTPGIASRIFKASTPVLILPNKD